MRRAALLGVAALALAGCGHGPSGLGATDYAHRTCTAIAGYESTLQTQAQAYQAKVSAAKGNARTLQSEAVAFLQQQVTGSGALITALQAVPRPAGTGGDRVRTAIVGGAQQAQGVFRAQASAVQAADAGMPTTFFTVLDTAQQQVGLAGQDIAAGIEGVAQYGDDALNKAFGADKVCAGL